MNTATRNLLLLNSTSAAAAAFAPTDIANLGFWFDAAQGTFQDSSFTTPASSDTDVVGGWRDQSGNGYDVIQGTTALKPTLQLSETPNGVSAIEYDGSDDTLDNTSVDLVTQTFTGFCVASTVTGSFSGFFVLGSTSSGGILWRMNGLDKQSIYKSGVVHIGTCTNAVSTDPTYVLHVVTYDGTNFAFRNDGADNGSGSNAFTFATGTNLIRIGQGASTSHTTDRAIAEILYYTRVLTADEISQVEGYLNTKHGVY